MLHRCVYYWIHHSEILGLGVAFLVICNVEVMEYICTGIFPEETKQRGWIKLSGNLRFRVHMKADCAPKPLDQHR